MGAKFIYVYFNTYKRLDYNQLNIVTHHIRINYIDG